MDGNAGADQKYRNATLYEIFKRQQKDRAFIRYWISFFTGVIAVLMILVGFKEVFDFPTRKKIFLSAYAM
jgi:hypothetical protein